MKSLFVRTIIAAVGFSSLYLGSGQSARADEWGCQVILCLSNPGGPTQYAECRPPVHKLWRWLAKGRSFPTCSGVGFQSSRPRYEPLYCSEGYRLTRGFGSRGHDATCMSSAIQVVDNSLCQRNRDGGRGSDGAVISARWHWDNGRSSAWAMSRPAHLFARNIDVTIDGVGKHRVWF